MRLDEVLRDLEVSVEPLAVCSVAAGWRLQFAPTAVAVVHYVLEGEGAVDVDDRPMVDVRTGSVVVVPGGCRHALTGAGVTRHRRYRRPTAGPEDGGVPLLAAGPAGPGTLRVVCGWVDATALSAFPLLTRMDEPLVVEAASPGLHALFTALLDEADRRGPARRETVTALMQACLVVTLRSACDATGNLHTWTKPQWSRLRPALERVLDDPGAGHTVASLAREAHMSRSAFGSAFLDGVGEPPMAFVRRMRLRRAAAMLRATDLPVASVAHAVGFSSRSHFTRAFADAYGSPPSSYRRDPRPPAGVS